MRAGNNSTSIAAIGPYTMVTYTTKMNNIKATIGLLIVAGSALSGYPAAASSAFTCFWKAAIAALRSAPFTTFGSGAVMELLPLRITASVPAGAFSLLYDTLAFARKLFAMSHDVESNAFFPTGSNWKEHSFGSATTVTGAEDCAAYKAGFA